MSLPPPFRTFPHPSSLPVSFQEANTLQSLNSSRESLAYMQMTIKFKIHFLPLFMLLNMLNEELGSTGLFIFALSLAMFPNSIS